MSRRASARFSGSCSVARRSSSSASARAPRRTWTTRQHVRYPPGLVAPGRLQQPQRRLLVARVERDRGGVDLLLQRAGRGRLGLQLARAHPQIQPTRSCMSRSPGKRVRTSFMRAAAPAKSRRARAASPRSYRATASRAALDFAGGPGAGGVAGRGGLATGRRGAHAAISREAGSEPGAASPLESPEPPVARPVFLARDRGAVPQTALTVPNRARDGQGGRVPRLFGPPPNASVHRLIDVPLL